MSTRKLFMSLAVAASVLCVCSMASAGFVSDPMFVIEASNDVGQARFEVPVSAGVPDGDTLTWTLQEPIVLIEDGADSTMLEMAIASYVADPIVNLNFVVSSGSATVYTVTSASLSFPSIPNATGRATAAVTVTDMNGNGAAMTGLNPNNQIYESFYNDSLNLPATGTSFASLLNSITAPPISSDTASANFPAGAGFSTVDQANNTLGTVSSMSSQFTFQTSSGDSASGTSTFVIIPEPAGMLLIVLGSFLLARFRRS